MFKSAKCFILVIVLAVSLFLSLGSGPVSAGINQWTQIYNGLTGTDVEAVAIDPATPTTIYAGINDVFRSTDGGNNWTQFNNGLPGTWISALVIDPVTPTTIYAGTWKGVFRSTDSGNNWIQVNNGLTDLIVRVLAIDTAMIYAGTNYDGVFRSTDNGNSWTQVSNGLTDTRVNALAIDPVTPTTLYAGTNYAGVFRSTDSGNNWTQVNNGLTYTGLGDLAIDPVTPTTLYAGTYNGGVFRSTDGGNNWTWVSSGLTSTRVVSLAIDPVTPTTIYAGAHGIFRSTDSGGNWTQINNGLTLTDTDLPVLEIARTTPPTLYAGTDSGVFEIRFQDNEHTIWASAGDYGSINPSGVVTVSESQTFTITPGAGYDEYLDEGIYNIHTRYVKDVMVDGVSVGAVTSYTFENVTDDHSIDAIFGETVSRIEIVCDRTFGNYDFGSLAQNPVIGLYPYEDGYTPSVTIDGTTVPVETEGDYYWVRIDTTADHTIHITFNSSLPQYTITAIAGSNGTITPSGVVTVSGSQTFAITPDAGYDEYLDEGIYNIHTRYVKDVMVDGESVGAVTSYTFENVTNDHSIDAIFGETVSRIEIICDSMFGGYDPFGSLAQNPVIPLYPYEDGYIPSVTIDGAAAPVESGEYAPYYAPYIVHIDTTADHTIRITFSPSLSQYTLTTAVQGSGSITKNPHSYFYNSGTIVSLTAVPDSGHRFDHWEGNAAGTQANTAVTVTDEMSVSAVFVPKDEPGIYVRPAGLEIYEDSEDRSRAFYAQNVASTEAADDKGKGLVIPHTVVKYWRTHKPRLNYSRADLTKSEDWSVNDSPVKNQGSCGSCWAFAAAALIENLGNKDDLAEQVLVSCISESNGCSGGWYGYALDHIHNKGLPPEDCYPYIAQNGNCGTQCSSPSFVVKVEERDTYGRWGVPDQDTVSNLKYLLQTGPVLVSMRVPTDGTFNKYQDGIYDYDGGAVPENRGHAVLAVGYDDDGQYFKVKNSWGPWWGEGGYFRIAYNDVTDHVQFGGYACTASGAYTAEEGDEDTLAFTIENTGAAALSVLLSCDKTWLTYAPQTTFFVYPGEQEEVFVSVSDWSKVAKPEETATISVSSNDPDNPLVIVTVRAVPKTETTGHGIVSGQVITNVAGHPVNVAGATVTIQGRSAVSDAAGKYTIVNVPDGTHEVRFESDHLGSVTESVTVTQGQISIMPAVSLSCPSQSVVINMQDTNGDNKIGLEEAIRALQIAAGIIE